MVRKIRIRLLCLITATRISRANPFKGSVAKPNWTITYNGLSKIGGLERIFTNVIIRHGYHSTLGMNSFNTALLFQDPLRVSYPYFRDTLTGNFIPYLPGSKYYYTGIIRSVDRSGYDVYEPDVNKRRIQENKTAES